MFSFRRSVGVLAVTSLVSFGALAQSTGSSSNPPAQDQTQPQAPAATQSEQGPATVQARIRARREARRAQAIHDTYAHLYEVFVGGGYQRFTPGPNLQRATMYSWDAAISRYWSEKLGLTFEGRGNYGTAFVGLNETSVTRPSISYYDVLVGPTYRFRLRPRYSIAGSVKGGVAMSNFSGDTNGFGTAVLGLYPDGTTYAINASVIGEVNITPNFSLRLAPEYMATGFGSTLQNDLGFTYGFVYRFGRQ
ncbi:MAG: hypothetical protein WBX19_12685 [Terracidiphilus sp.]